MDLTNSKEVKAFVKRTIEAHPDAELTPENFIEKTKTFGDSEEFNQAIDAADAALEIKGIISVILSSLLQIQLQNVRRGRCFFLPRAFDLQ